MGFLEADGCISLSSGGSLKVSVANTQRVLPEVFAAAFSGGRWEERAGGGGRQRLYRWFAPTDDSGLRRLPRRLAVVPFAGPKGAKLRLLPRYRGLRRAGAHRARGGPEAAAWAAFWRRWSSLRGVAPKRMAADPPLDPYFCQRPVFRSGGPRPAATDRRRLAALLATGSRLGLWRSHGKVYPLLVVAAEERDRPLMERLQRWLGAGFWRRCRRPTLELRGATSLHRLGALVAPHWRQAYRRWRRCSRLRRRPRKPSW